MTYKWFKEKWSEDTIFSIKISKHIHSEKTPFQQLDVFESIDYGRFFSLDGYLMLTEKDEFIYHEMIVHPAINVNPNIKNVLVIGGGDGGTIRELTRYGNIQKIDMVELDERVVRISQKFFPKIAIGLKDNRVNIFFKDGLEYVKNTEKKYDLIIVDSTDPIGPGEGLFTADFYLNCYRILSKDGIMINQNESPYYDDTQLEFKRAFSKIKQIFPIALTYQAHIPTYASGHWLFGFGSKKLHPIHDFKKENFTNLKTKYYNDKIHCGSFALPNYVLDIIK